ncbi:MAG: alpha/beta hydrolase [Tissierellia bacterium]|nr:alpha/beta hydrolase [Tissierellia bacterium]
MEQHQLAGKGGHTISLYTMEAQNPFCKLQIVHDAGENASTYEDVMKELTQRGISCSAMNLRGHDNTKSDQCPLFFSTRNGWNNVVDDIHVVDSFLATDQLPHFLLGVGMGADLIRTYLFKFGETLQGALLLGATPYVNALSFGIVDFFADHLTGRFGELYRSPLLASWAFERGFHPLKRRKTRYNANRKKEETIPTLSLIRDLSRGLKNLQEEHSTAYIPRELPLLFMAGTQDSIAGGRGKQEALVDFYSSMGKNAQLILYKNGAHDLLHGECKDLVINDLERFLKETSQ